MTKPDYIANLERRQKVLEDAIAEALRHHATDDLMVVDLKHRMLHLKSEIEKFRDVTAADGRLH